VHILFLYIQVVAKENSSEQMSVDFTSLLRCHVPWLLRLVYARVSKLWSAVRWFVWFTCLITRAPRFVNVYVFVCLSVISWGVFLSHCVSVCVCVCVCVLCARVCLYAVRMFVDSVLILRVYLFKCCLWCVYGAIISFNKIYSEFWFERDLKHRANEPQAMHCDLLLEYPHEQRAV